ncbi:MAG: hypothetical protein JWQ30_900, partial [Sediminibacterium sp.]|nr:hypothetical protein [Sediminibacterium sp.]
MRKLLTLLSLIQLTNAATNQEPMRQGWTSLTITSLETKPCVL